MLKATQILDPVRRLPPRRKRMDTAVKSRLASRLVPLLVLGLLTVGAAPGGRGCDALAHHHCPDLVRSIDGSTADHAFRHPVCGSRRVGAPAAGTEDGEQYGGGGGGGA